MPFFEACNGCKRFFAVIYSSVVSYFYLAHFMYYLRKYSYPQKQRQMLHFSSCKGLVKTPILILICENCSAAFLNFLLISFCHPSIFRFYERVAKEKQQFKDIFVFLLGDSGLLVLSYIVLSKRTVERGVETKVEIFPPFFRRFEF